MNPVEKLSAKRFGIGLADEDEEEAEATAELGALAFDLCCSVVIMLMMM